MTKIVLKTPVLFLIFNRPAETKASFAAIRESRPRRLYIAADGPRTDHPDDAELCKRARQVALKVDWPCEVTTRFLEENAGCAKAVGDALRDFFSQEEEGIVLEDDCVAHSDFFTYCQTLLERYRNDERVSMIGGSNYQFGKRRGSASYYFSALTHVWGWATWARTFALYDRSMPGLEEFIKSRLATCALTRHGFEHFAKSFSMAALGLIDSWAYPFEYSIWKNNGGFGILPNVNLVRNIGFTGSGTHTNARSPLELRGVNPLGEMVHPDAVERNFEADRFYEELVTALNGHKALLLDFVTTEIARRTADGDEAATEEMLTAFEAFYPGLRQKMWTGKISGIARPTFPGESLDRN